MLTARTIACLSLLLLTPAAFAQSAPPTAYTIIEGVNGQNDGNTITVYRSGSKVLMESNHPALGATPAARSFTLYDLTSGTTWTWDPTANPIQCNAGKFSGDWGDPFGMTGELTDGIKKGELKPAGAETLAGVTTQVYAGSTSGAAIKVWLDQKDGLVIKAVVGVGTPQSMTMADIRRVMIGVPSATHFVLPPACAGTKPPPTPAELIAAETGDSADNFVRGAYGPGSRNTCTIALHVVQAKTMAPVTRKWQVAIDTTYQVGEPNPPHYTFGSGTDGTSTFSGGGVHEVTNQVHNGVLRIVNPPASFEIDINVITPGHGTGSGGVYRQCFGPVTNLYYVMSDQMDPSKPAEYLYAKSGKYAVAP
jgi:hypothetical protein